MLFLSYVLTRRMQAWIVHFKETDADHLLLGRWLSTLKIIWGGLNILLNKKFFNLLALSVLVSYTMKFLRYIPSHLIQVCFQVCSAPTVSYSWKENIQGYWTEQQKYFFIEDREQVRIIQLFLSQSEYKNQTQSCIYIF